MIEESVLIWMEVKNHAPTIIKSGGNPIEVHNHHISNSFMIICQVLLWARGKTLGQVRNFLSRGGMFKFEEIRKERRESVVENKMDSNLDIMKRRKSSVKIDLMKNDDNIKKVKGNDNEKLRKIRQMVEFDENSIALSSNQKKVFGIVEEE